MDIALLRTFVATVDLGGVARAAERVGRSQSAVSLQLKRLGAAVQGPLFRKHGRNLRLTDSGDILLNYARRILELNDEAVGAVTALGLSGSIHLGISQDFAEGWLTSVLARFARAHPSIMIDVKVDRNHELPELLARRQLDFALMFGEDDARDAINLGRVPVVWIGAAGYRRDNADCVPLVLFDPPCAFRRVALEALDNAGMPWRLALSSPSLSSQWSAVEAGLGVSLRTPIGLRPPLSAIGENEGLPDLGDIGLNVLLFPAGEGSGEAASALQNILTDTVRERLE